MQDLQCEAKIQYLHLDQAANSGTMEYCTVDACTSCQAMREVEIKLSEAEALVERLNRENPSQLIW